MLWGPAPPADHGVVWARGRLGPRSFLDDHACVTRMGLLFAGPVCFELLRREGRQKARREGVLRLHPSEEPTISSAQAQAQVTLPRAPFPVCPRIRRC